MDSGRSGMPFYQPKKPPLYTSSSCPQLPLDCFLDEQRLLFAKYRNPQSRPNTHSEGAHPCSRVAYCTWQMSQILVCCCLPQSICEFICSRRSLQNLTIQSKSSSDPYMLLFGSTHNLSEPSLASGTPPWRSLWEYSLQRLLYRVANHFSLPSFEYVNGALDPTLIPICTHHRTSSLTLSNPTRATGSR